MTIENRECAYLLSLLSCALKCEEPPAIPDGLDFGALFSIAKKQQIYNIIFPLIQNMDGVPPEEKEQWRNYAYSELVRTVAVDHDRDIILKAFEAQGINYMFLKGLVLREYYPKASMRQMSDNDILYDPAKRDAVLRIMKNLHYKLVACGENSDDFHKSPYFTFEFHRTLFFEEKEFCPRFDRVWERAAQDDQHPHQYHMDVSDNYIYSVAHMYKHFSTNGCGVRFLADIYLLYKKEASRLDQAYIDRELEQMGIGDFAEKALRLALDLFGGEELTQPEISFLTTFLQGGVYGDSTLTLVRGFEAERQDARSAASAKRKYLLHRLFPSKKTMKANFKTLEKYPFLLPWFYFVRLLRLPGKRKEAMAEARAIEQIAQAQSRQHPADQ